MTRRLRKAAGPSVAASDEPAAVAPDGAPIAWPDHPLAASGGEILATRILPLMGHNARDFARAAAVCRGWRAACRAAASTVSVYRGTALRPMEADMDADFVWSPCGKYVAATACHIMHSPRLFIWRASTGALVNEWALATPATAILQEAIEHVIHTGIDVYFSRDGMRAMTLFIESNHFAIWSMPDGQLMAVNPGSSNYDYLASYHNADFGVPGSASDGLVGFAEEQGSVHLWDVSPQSEGGPIRPRLRSGVFFEPHHIGFYPGSFSFTPDGSKFVVAHAYDVYVYDVASLTQLHTYTSPSQHVAADWAPDGQRLLVSWYEGGCVWDFSRPEAPSILTIYVSPGTDLRRGWSPSGASFFFSRRLEGQPPGPGPYALEERRAVDGSLLRAVNLGHMGRFPSVKMSPDANALLLYSSEDNPVRVIVFE